MNNVFLHGDLEEEVNMRMPPSFACNDPNKVCKLKKNHYMDLNRLLDSGLQNCLPNCMSMDLFALILISLCLFTATAKYLFPC